MLSPEMALALALILEFAVVMLEFSDTMDAELAVIVVPCAVTVVLSRDMAVALALMAELAEVRPEFNEAMSSAIADPGPVAAVICVFT